MTRKRQRQEIRERRSLGPCRRLLVVLSYLMGLGVFLASISLSLLAVAPKWWPFPEIAWSLFILTGGLVAVILHMFFGFLVGGGFDRMRADMKSKRQGANEGSPTDDSR